MHQVNLIIPEEHLNLTLETVIQNLTNNGTIKQLFINKKRLLPKGKKVQ
jgi:hypothetical protein